MKEVEVDHLTGEAVVVIRHLAVEGEVLALLVLVRLTSKLFIRVSEKGAETHHSSPVPDRSDCDFLLTGLLTC